MFIYMCVLSFYNIFRWQNSETRLGHEYERPELSLSVPRVRLSGLAETACVRIQTTRYKTSTHIHNTHTHIHTKTLYLSLIYRTRTENAATPYQAAVYIGGMQYGVGYGSSKRQAKYAAARASIHILIPEMKNHLEPPAAAPQNPETDFTVNTHWHNHTHTHTCMHIT